MQRFRYEMLNLNNVERYSNFFANQVKKNTEIGLIEQWDID